jgi:hypothetical protein
VPFFINWGSTRHPAEDAPSGCILKKLRAQHPNPEHLTAVLEALGLDLSVEYGPIGRLKALIETHKGLVELE